MLSFSILILSTVLRQKDDYARQLLDRLSK